MQQTGSAESARWGDAKITDPRDKYDDWLPEVTDLENNFFPVRSGIVVSQLRSAGIYSSLEPPVVKESGMVISGNLSNAGEFLLINDKNRNKLISFAFSDDPPWPAEADGAGFSLVPVELNPKDNPDLYSYWRRSGRIGGSPFADDDASTATDKLLYREWGDLAVYPNPSAGVIAVQLDEELSGQLTLRFTDQAGATALVMKVEDISVIDLREKGLAPACT